MENHKEVDSMQPMQLRRMYPFVVCRKCNGLKHKNSFHLLKHNELKNTVMEV